MLNPAFWWLLCLLVGSLGREISFFWNYGQEVGGPIHCWSPTCRLGDQLVPNLKVGGPVSPVHTVVAPMISCTLAPVKRFSPAFPIIPSFRTRTYTMLECVHSLSEIGNEIEPNTSPGWYINGLTEVPSLVCRGCRIRWYCISFCVHNLSARGVHVVGLLLADISSLYDIQMTGARYRRFYVAHRLRVAYKSHSCFIVAWHLVTCFRSLAIKHAIAPKFAGLEVCRAFKAGREYRPRLSTEVQRMQPKTVIQHYSMH